ncbi:MAG: hypothetical protein CMJ38_00275 [Phycisphaerae bacterium]|nr:hypothetical protein [Phycisphaerae bacterium]|tara:strand:+ start:609 stop:1622 length:1014 start_codon:yes stop_codon:yes gene_type:complete
MKIVILSNETSDDYKEFINNNKNTLFYHQIKYKNLLKYILGCDENYILLYDDNKLCGVLPILLKDGKYGHILNSLPYYGSNGGIIAENNKYKASLINIYNDLSNEVGSAVYVENPFEQNDFIPKSNLQEERISQVTLLDKIEDIYDLDNCFTPSKRWDIKKAIKSKVRIFKNNSRIAQEFLYKTHKNHMQSIGMQWKSRGLFEYIFSNFIKGSDYDIFVGKINDKLISALLVLYFKNITEYYCPVVLNNYRSSQALSLTIYEAMKNSLEMKRKIWNWGASGDSQNSSVYKFKKKWLTIDKKYYYHILINNKQIFSSNKYSLEKNYNGFFVIPYSKLK